MFRYTQRIVVSFLYLTLGSFVFADTSVLVTKTTPEQELLSSKVSLDFVILSPLVFTETDHSQIGPDETDLIIQLPSGFVFDTSSKVSALVTNKKLDNSGNCAGAGNKTLRLGTSSSGTLSLQIAPEENKFLIRIKQASAGNCKGELTLSGMKIKGTSSTVQSGVITFSGTTNLFGLIQNETSLGNLVVIDDIEEDEIPPELVLLGEDVVTVEVHSEFLEPGFEVSDNVDENVVVEIEGSVNTHVLGEYVLTYKAVDSSLNETVRTRRVKVVDTTAPTLRLIGDNPLRVKLLSIFTDPGVEVSDNYDEDISYSVSGVVDTSVAQTFTLTYVATDQSGNIASITRDVLVTEKLPPTLNLKGDDEITVEATHPYVDLGAEAFDSSLNNISNMISVFGLPIDTSKVGTHTITYRVSFDGLSVEKTRRVKVIDTTPPIIRLIGDGEVYIQEGEVFNDPFVYAFDSVDKDLSLSVERTYVPEDLSVGVYEILYSVVDSSGNSASISRKLFVREKTNINSSSQKLSTKQGSTKVANANFLSISSTKNTLPTTEAVLGASTVCTSQPLFKEGLNLKNLSEDEAVYLKQFLNQEFRLALPINSEVTDLLVEALHIFMLSRNISNEEMRNLLQSKVGSSCSS